MLYGSLADVINDLEMRSRIQGHTVPFLADVLGVSAQHLYRIMRGERQPSFDLLLRWARAVNGELSVTYSVSYKRPAGSESAGDVDGTSD